MTPLPEQQAYIFDMDGTLSDASWRLHYLYERPKNWNAFFEGCDRDQPIPGICSLLQSLYRQGYKILVFSARKEISRTKTITWIQRHCLPELSLDQISDLVTLRPNDNHTNDDILKCQWVRDFQAQHPTIQIIAAFEDRPRIIQAYREIGLFVLDPGTWQEDL